jgi:2-(1,2-epoxy-1,2-dihydrophenyl)acetyl-CoA isomerase
MRLLKHAIDNAADMTFEQACMDIAARTAISDHHPDAKEGAAAFKAKPRRKPTFNQA